MRLQTAPPQTTAADAARAFWPDAVAYREAIQNPTAALADPQLAGAQVLVGRQGMPVAYAGRFAVVFRLRTGGGDWALRCFTSRGAEDERRAHYALVAPRLAAMPDTFVPFRYLDQGIRVGGNWYPALAMRWAEGETLGRFIEDHRHDPNSLRTLSQALASLLERLETAGIGHGDWQHDNILVADGGKRLTLVDYDGVFVPELTGRPAPEIGHANYQHPSRTRNEFGPGLDRFSHLVIQTALHALIADPSLCDRFPLDDALLFRRSDFTAPLSSPVFNAVKMLATRDAALAERLTRLKVACASGRAGVLLPPALSSAPATAVLTATAEKWWLAAEAPATPTNKTVPQATPVQVTLMPARNYLGKAQNVMTQMTERNNMRIARFFLSLGVLNLLLSLVKMPVLPEQALALSLFYFLVPPFCYLFWPWKSLLDQLDRDLAFFTDISIGNQAIIRRLRKQLEKLAEVPVNMTADEYVADRLGQIPIRKVERLFDIGRTTVKRLERAEIHTAAHIEGRLDTALISPRRREAVEEWYNALKEEAVETYLLATRDRRDMENQLQRLEEEEAVRKAQRKDLRAQRRKFPDTSLGGYARRVLGIDRT